MKRMVSARELVGRRIVGFEVETFPAGSGMGTAHCPRMMLDDGTWLYFLAEETDGADYGVFIGRGKPWTQT